MSNIIISIKPKINFASNDENKENICPITGITSNIISPIHDSGSKKRIALKDITPVRVASLPKKIRPTSSVLGNSHSNTTPSQTITTIVPIASSSKSVKTNSFSIFSSLNNNNNNNNSSNKSSSSHLSIRKIR